VATSTGASMERRLERLEAAAKARRQSQVVVVRLIDEEPSEELWARDDVTVIQRVTIAPPDREVEIPPSLPSAVTPSIERPHRAGNSSAPPPPDELRQMRADVRFSEFVRSPLPGIV
jgi:hypothetical protein